MAEQKQEDRAAGFKKGVSPQAARDGRKGIAEAQRQEAKEEMLAARRAAAVLELGSAKPASPTSIEIGSDDDLDQEPSVDERIVADMQRIAQDVKANPALFREGVPRTDSPVVHP